MLSGVLVGVSTTACLNTDWSIVQDTKPGFVMYRTIGNDDSLTPHQLMNAGPERVMHYVIELLGPTATDVPISETNGRVSEANDRARLGRARLGRARLGRTAEPPE